MEEGRQGEMVGGGEREAGGRGREDGGMEVGERGRRMEEER